MDLKRDGGRDGLRLAVRYRSGPCITSPEYDIVTYRHRHFSRDSTDNLDNLEQQSNILELPPSGSEPSCCCSPMAGETATWRNERSISFNDLPDEVLQHILYFLSPLDVFANTQNVSKRFNRLCSEPLLWRHHCQVQFKYWDSKHRIKQKYLGSAGDSGQSPSLGMMQKTLCSVIATLAKMQKMSSQEGKPLSLSDIYYFLTLIDITPMQSWTISIDRKGWRNGGRW